MGDMWFPRVTKAYRGLQGVRAGYKTGSYRGFKRLQRVTRSHKG